MDRQRRLTAEPQGLDPALLGTQVAYCLGATFTTLLYNQPAGDPAYRGATPARFLEGKGLTCDPPPPGYERKGFADESMHVPGGFYPYYAP